MARTLKKGLDYFPIDAGWDRDIKTVFIINTYKTAALAVIPAIFKQIYTDAGYYAEATEIFYKSMAAVCFVEPDTVREIVEAGLESGLFTREKFADFGILTSAGIQRRYLRARREIARKPTPIEAIFRPEFLLLDGEEAADGEDDKPAIIGDNRRNSPIIGDNRRKSAKIGENARLSPQRKEKKRKVNITINPPPTPPTGGGAPENSEIGELTETGDDRIVEAWNEVFPPGDPRHVNGGVIGLNCLFLANSQRTLAEYPPDAQDGIAVYRRAFEALKVSDFSWQIHSAIKLENFKTLLTEADNAARQPVRRSPPGEGSHRAPVNTREDFLANPWPFMAKSN